MGKEKSSKNKLKMVNQVDTISNLVTVSIKILNQKE
jgi:hypothetical protein